MSDWLDISSIGLNLNMDCTFRHITYISARLSNDGYTIDNKSAKILNMSIYTIYLEHSSLYVRPTWKGMIVVSLDVFLWYHTQARYGKKYDVPSKHANQRTKVYLLVNYITKNKYIHMLWTMGCIESM